MGLFRIFRYFRNSEHVEDVKAYIKSVTIGDWFVLYQMSKNLNRRFFHDFLIQLSKEAKLYELEPFLANDDEKTKKY